MNTQISAETFRRAQRYSGVYQQQGRMLRDADWNELVDVIKDRLTTALGDVVGSGLPEGAGVLSATGPQFGRAYVDGIEAELVADPSFEGGTPNPYANQADFPSPPALPASYVLYLDVWERVVSALEDADLLDVALHGADTCTRTQVLTQLKWCPLPSEGGTAACDDSAQNPRSGDAVLTAALRGGGSGPGPDPCDPCAEQIDVSAPVGNYLFRLEVHSVEGTPTNPTRVVLKWSSENGAEQHPVGSVPVDFAAPGYVFEQFDDTTERQLGVHLAGGFVPSRGILSSSLPTTGGGYVRRWDGAMAFVFTDGGITLDTGSDPAASDLGVSLTAAANLDGHGNVTGGTTSLGLALRSLSLTLGVSGSQFVAGDYWEVLVRERDTSVRVLSPTPRGVIHHYLTLGQVSGGAFTPVPHSTQRFAFPPLTDIQAGNVGYSNPGCANGLLSSATTVADALNAICNLNATEVSYSGGSCANPAVASAATVQAAIDALCGLNATEVPFTPGTCEVLTGAKTVADALELLCEHAVQGDDFCIALLRLFGRGVICGLIPSITVGAVIAGTGEVPITVNVTDGTVIDGRGCVVVMSNVAALQTNVQTYVPLGIDLPPLPVNQVVNAIQTGLKQKNLSGIVSSNQLQPLARLLTGKKFTTQQELTSAVAAATGITNQDVIGAIAGGLGTVGQAPTTRTVEVKQWLYLVSAPGQAPQLELTMTAPTGGLSLPADVVAGFDNPAGGPVITAGAGCSTAESEAWQLYTDVPCVKTNGDGAICLGTVGVFGQAGWTSPDDREQVFPTPAVTSARWRMQRQPTYNAIKQACIAGPVNVTDIRLGTSTGPSLKGQGLLAATTGRSAVIVLSDVVRGNAVTVSLSSQNVDLAVSAVTIQPGSQVSAPFQFNIHDLAGTASITATIASQQPYPASFTAVQIEGLAMTGGGTSVMLGDINTATVSLSSAASEAVVVNLAAQSGVVAPPSITIPSGQTTSASVNVEIHTNATPGPVNLTATAAGQTRTTTITGVGLSGLQTTDGRSLQNVIVNTAGVSAVVVLTAPAPKALTATIVTSAMVNGQPAAILLPTLSTVSIAQGQTKSTAFHLGSSVPAGEALVSGVQVDCGSLALSLNVEVVR